MGDMAVDAPATRAVPGPGVHQPLEQALGLGAMKPGQPGLEVAVVEIVVVPLALLMENC